MNMQRQTWIRQGGQAVSDDPSVVITTLLGSCVSVCVWDPLAQVGGMNHMLLTRGRSGLSEKDGAGVNAMETLINETLKSGARRARLVAKVFGGAQMISDRSEIGRQNAVFAIEYLTRENILLMGHSLGGTEARQLKFWPALGIVRQRLVAKGPSERAPLEPAQEGNGMQLL